MPNTTRRVRAGTEPPPDMPVQFAKGCEEDHPYLDDPGPGWWEIGAALIIMVIVLLIVGITGWSAK